MVTSRKTFRTPTPGRSTGSLEAGKTPGTSVADLLAQAQSATYLRTAEVADRMSVSPKTVSRWARDGKLPFVKTLGGHRRFPEKGIDDIIGDQSKSLDNDFRLALE